MNQLQSIKPPGSSRPQSQTSNPFAKALAEMEKNPTSMAKQADNTPKLNPFSEALARSGGSLGNMQDMQNPDFLAKQQEEMLAKQRKEALRKKLHDQVNPVDQRELFNAREKRVKEEIERLRDDLKMLASDVAAFEKQVELTLLTEIVDPGIQGSYFTNFLHQLRSFIMLLRQKVQSAKTWATQMNGKKKKKGAKRQGKGLSMEGSGSEKTSTVHDMMHQERSSSYTGA